MVFIPNLIYYFSAVNPMKKTINTTIRQKYKYFLKDIPLIDRFLTR